MSLRPGAPSPKKPKLDLRKSPKSQSAKSSQEKSSPSPKKFRPKKYYSPKKSSPPKKVPNRSGQESLEVFQDDCFSQKEATNQRSSGEVYYTANFKEVLNRCLLPSNPERHVISDQEAALVKQFMELESG